MRDGAYSGSDKTIENGKILIRSFELFVNKKQMTLLFMTCTKGLVFFAATILSNQWAKTHQIGISYYSKGQRLSYIFGNVATSSLF